MPNVDPGRAPAPERIVFDVSVEDLVAFNLYFLRKEGRRRHQVLAAGLLLLFAAALYAYWCNGYLLVNFLGGLAVLSLASVLFVALSRRRVAAFVRRNAREDKGSRVGRHTMEVRDGRLWERTAVDETSISLSALYGIETTPEHLFVMRGPAYAWVVPRHRVVEGDAGAFEGALLDALQGGTGRITGPEE